MSEFETKDVLVIGKGGREHAIAWLLHNSEMVENVYIAPGNPGTAQIGTNVDCNINDFEAVAEVIEKFAVDMTIIGPEQPLVDGLVDFLEKRGHPVFGPSKTRRTSGGQQKFCQVVHGSATTFQQLLITPTKEVTGIWPKSHLIKGKHGL